MLQKIKQHIVDYSRLGEVNSLLNVNFSVFYKCYKRLFYFLSYRREGHAFWNLLTFTISWKGNRRDKDNESKEMLFVNDDKIWNFLCDTSSFSYFINVTKDYFIFYLIVVHPPNGWNLPERLSIKIGSLLIFSVFYKILYLQVRRLPTNGQKLAAYRGLLSFRRG